MCSASNQDPELDPSAGISSTVTTEFAGIAPSEDGKGDGRDERAEPARLLASGRGSHVAVTELSQRTLR
jgi:hypothetical protein